MKFRVSWTETAEQNLAAVWIAAAARNAITSAAHLIDTELAEDPQEKGALRFDTVRTLVVSQLGVDFEVVEADCRVFVLSVWDTTQN